MNNYCLRYSYGLHHVSFSCSKESFFKVIDDLSSEFTIHKDFLIRDTYKVTHYYVENYLGDLDLIGTHCEDN